MSTEPPASCFAPVRRTPFKTEAYRARDFGCRRPEGDAGGAAHYRGVWPSKLLVSIIHIYVINASIIIDVTSYLRSLFREPKSGLGSEECFSVAASACLGEWKILSS